MVVSSVRNCAYESLRNFRKGKNYVLDPHAVAILATGSWSILRVFFPGRTRPSFRKQGNVIPNTTNLVPHLSALFSYRYVVFISYLVQALLILSLVIGMHTLSLDLNNECGNPEYRAILATV